MRAKARFYSFLIILGFSVTFIALCAAGGFTTISGFIDEQLYLTDHRNPLNLDNLMMLLDRINILPRW